MILVVGSTGFLGATICRRLHSAGHKTRALVRDTSDPQKVRELKKLGAEIVVGDLKDEASLTNACQGISTVISTASSTLSQQEGDSITTVDRDGQLALVKAAKDAHVKHFIYVSFHPMAEQFPLQDAKRVVERAILESGITYTILQPTFFMEVWLGPHLGFDAVNATARLYGSGENQVPWISIDDVARFVVASVDNSAARNRTIELGGPEHLSPRDVVKRFEGIRGKSFEVEFVAEDALRSQLAAATNLLEKSFAGLMLGYHQGFSVDMKPVLNRLPVRQTTITEYAHKVLEVSPSVTH